GLAQETRRRLAAEAADPAARAGRVRAAVDGGDVDAALVADATAERALERGELAPREATGREPRLVRDDDDRVAGLGERAQADQRRRREPQQVGIDVVGNVLDEGAGL